MKALEKELEEEKPNPSQEKVVKKYKRRMLEWPNPVEYVNNMYGCHPDNQAENEKEYFKFVFDD